MAEENTQTNTQPAAPAVQPSAPAVPQPVAPAPVAATPAPVVATPAPVAATPAPVAATPAPAAAPAQPVTPATPSTSPAPGLGVGQLKDAASLGQAGLSKMTGTLSSIGGNVMGAVSGECHCPEIKAEDWDKKHIKLDKTFYKTFSTRLFGYHFSDAIDKNRGEIEVKVKDYKPVEKPMVLDTNSLFISDMLIEIASGNASDPKVISFAGKDIYTKVSKNTNRKLLKMEALQMENELGKKPQQVYYWFVSCPKCDAKKEVKTIIFALV